jgi:hypothetical protein
MHGDRHVGGSVHGVVVQIAAAIGPASALQRAGYGSTSGNDDVDRARRDVAVLDLRLGERGLTRRAPMHGLLAAIELAARHELRELAHLGRLVAVLGREVGIRPIADRRRALEVLALHVDELRRVVATEPSDLDLPERGFLLLAELLFDLVLDRQPVTIPARHVRRLEAGHVLVLHDHVFDDLVERVAEMDAAVGIGRAVVQHVARPAGPRRQPGGIDVEALPLRQDLRLARGKIGTHRKRRGREIEGALEVRAPALAHRRLAINASRSIADAWYHAERDGRDRSRDATLCGRPGSNSRAHYPCR